MAVLVGMFVTMVIQSSSATSVMVVGFVNASIMTIQQAVGVIFGANIGTTITGQMVSFNLSQWAPIAIGTGILMGAIVKNPKVKEFAEILVGFWNFVHRYELFKRCFSATKRFTSLYRMDCQLWT